MIEMGVSVHISLVAVGGPSCVSDSNKVIMLSFCLKSHPLDTISTKPICRSQLIELELTCFSINGDDPTRVISPRFKYGEPFNANITSFLLISKVSYDATALILSLLLHLHVHISHQAQGGEGRCVEASAGVGSEDG